MCWIEEIIRSETEGMTRDEAEGWIDDVEYGGCAAGTVGALIYYNDTRRVYEANESAIISALDDIEYRDDTDRGLSDVSAIMNARVWVAFEVGARGVFEGMEWPDEDEDRGDTS